MIPSRFFSAYIVLGFGAQLAACVAPSDVDTSEDAIAALAKQSAAGAQSSPAQPPALPATLQCVSQATRADGEMFPSLWRIAIHFDLPRATFDATRATQFAHPASQAAAGGKRSTTATVTSHTKNVVLTLDGGGMVRIDRAGPFYRGVFLHGTADELTCWNKTELFGSPWLQQAGALRAHYRADTGACANADGEPAENAVPVEFVRETGLGDCADLRGAALNGDDYGYPSLAWQLRGAKLGGARLYFADLKGSLQGADFAGLEFGYATVHGASDAHTKVAPGCQVNASPWAGASVACSQ